MSIQFKRGTTAQHATYTGAVGEITFDTDKKVLVIHDGVTAGGWPQGAPSGSPVQPFNASSMNGGQLSGFRNKIINGDMQVSQVNGSSSVTVTAGAALNYVIDQFYAYSTGANVTAQRIAGSGSNQYRHRITGAAGVTAIGVGQRIEQANTYHLAGNTAIFGVDLANSLLTNVTWTAYYANTADTFGTLAAPTRTQIATGTFTVNGTVARYCTPAISIPAGATTGLEIVLTVGAQTSGTFTHGDWQFEQVSAGATQGTTFEHVSYADQLRWCQRYLPVFNGYNVLGAGYQLTATAAEISIKLPVDTRVAPIGIVVSSPGVFSFNNSVNVYASSAVAAYRLALSSSSVILTNTGVTLGSSGIAFMSSGQLYFTGAQL